MALTALKLKDKRRALKIETLLEKEKNMSFSNLTQGRSCLNMAVSKRQLRATIHQDNLSKFTRSDVLLKRLERKILILNFASFSQVTLWMRKSKVIK